MNDLAQLEIERALEFAKGDPDAALEFIITHSDPEVVAIAHEVLTQPHLKEGRMAISINKLVGTTLNINVHRDDKPVILDMKQSDQTFRWYVLARAGDEFVTWEFINEEHVVSGNYFTNFAEAKADFRERGS